MGKITPRDRVNVWIHEPVIDGRDATTQGDELDLDITAVRLKVEENQLVDVFGEICVGVDGLKSV